MLFATCVADSQRLVSATQVVLSLSPNQYGIIFYHKSGLSMNILRAGSKLPMQRSFFTNSAGDLLPALEFLGRLYNFCNFVIIFSLM